MARPKNAVPTYSLHTSSGRAVCYIDLRPIYLCEFNSPESRKASAELLEQLTTGKETGKPARQTPSRTSIAELLLHF